MEYQNKIKELNSPRTTYAPKDVHYWRPPCSCGVELVEALKVEENASKVSEKGEVHFWRPPCSCGVTLDEVVE